ncbi:hypothetical protein DPMN_122312 [Dreissena polymorpha]|uniref:Deacetylase sirtuin-type domain-containing protein n=1 Tax=Dreissena polymorpha TaxID=45954 RepID=A0A9D4GPF2_DREPO|nr:hypothetical protein DPMN_122312 [Dreissena polymorpha]
MLNEDIQRYHMAGPSFFFVPNKSHVALAEWERKGKVHWLVTQNVDALHYKAGSKKVTELHGSAHRVMCLECEHKMTRPEMQVLNDSYNPNWSAQSDEIAPDADVQLSQEQINGFKIFFSPHTSKSSQHICAIWLSVNETLNPDTESVDIQSVLKLFAIQKCLPFSCGGPLKPEITFFGDNVMKPIVECVHEKVKERQFAVYWNIIAGSVSTVEKRFELRHMKTNKV